MKNKMGIYFQLEMNDPKDTFSLMKLAVNRLEQLQDEGIKIEYLELRLHKSPFHQTKKQAYIKLDGNGSTFIDSGTSSRWDDAFITTFDRIHDQLRNHKTKSPESIVTFETINATN